MYCLCIYLTHCTYFNTGIKAMYTTVSYVITNILCAYMAIRANIWWSALEFGVITKYVQRTK